MDISALSSGISDLLFSPAITRILLLLIVIFYATSILRKYTPPFKLGLVAIPRILIVREILVLIYFTPVFFYFSDAIVLVLLIWWLYEYTQRLRVATMVLCVSTLIIQLSLAILYELVIRSEVILILANAHLIFVLVLYGVLLSTTEEHNAKNSEFITKNKYLLLFVAVLLARFTFFANPVLGQVIALNITLNGASLLLYLFLLYRYETFSHTKLSTKGEAQTQYTNDAFEFLRTIAGAIADQAEVKSVLEYTLKTIIKLTDAEAGVVLVKDEEGNLALTYQEGDFPPPYELPESVRTRISATATFFEETPVKAGETVLGEVSSQNEPVFIRNTIHDGRMLVNIKDDMQFINSLIAMPLRLNYEVFGVLAVAHRSKDRFFTQDLYEHSQVFVEFASLTLDSYYAHDELREKQAMDREISIANEIQQKLLPSILPKNIINTVSVWSQPLRGISGDYYDIIPLNSEGKIAIIICDVAGKGVPASLIMVMIRTITHLADLSHQSPATVLTQINKGISETVDIERFATMCYFTYDPVTKQVEYSNAAHHPLVICRKASGGIETLDTEGLPIGLDINSKYSTQTATLASGDSLMLYTDGIIEVMSPTGAQYEDARLQKVLVENVNRTASEILTAIKEDLAQFMDTEKQNDDQTIIIMQAP